MNEFEKVEKLRERANVSYEDAKRALEASNWDLLDAMILLEKEGKVASQKTYSTEKEEQRSSYSSVEDVVNNQKEEQNKESFGTKIKKFAKYVWQKGNDNSLVVTHEDKVVFKIPVWVFVIALLVAWHVILLAMVISLFFGCRYSFQGKDDLTGVNNVMDKASEMAEQVKDEFSNMK